MFRAGQYVALAGVVGPHTTRRKPAGRPLVVAPLHLENGETIDCLWMDGSRAPRSGLKVRVTGEVQVQNGTTEVLARLTESLAPQESAAVEHRLIRYFIDCLEAESAQELILRKDEAGGTYLLFTRGKSPLLAESDNHPGALPGTSQVKEWCTRRWMAGQGQHLFIGYPVVSAKVEREGIETEVLAALFHSECSVERHADEQFMAVPVTPKFDINPFALDLLGVSREERYGLIEGLETLQGLDEADGELERIIIRLDFLRSMGLIENTPDLDPKSLDPVTSGGSPAVNNAALLFAGERVLTTRGLLEDLVELLYCDPEEFRKGPLGYLFGSQSAPAPPDPRPSLSVIETNLSQDRAVASALESEFSVVTGPPGTGKSQVVVNAVAHSMVAGESVLFASKNNQAVDVVFDRLSSVSLEAAPLRAGEPHRGAELAFRINEALARPQVDSLPLADARNGWTQMFSELEPLYRIERDRDGLVQHIAESERRYAEMMAALPPNLLTVPLADLSAVEPLMMKLRSRANRYHWRANLFRHWEKGGLQELWSAILERLPSQPASYLPDRPDPPEILSLLDMLSRALEASQQMEHLHSARHELELLPDSRQVQERLEGLEPQRIQASRRLFDAAWMLRVRSAGVEPRQTAETYKNKLHLLTRGESASEVKGLVPQVIKTFPAWGVTSLSARTNLPLQQGLFDLVVIDEASQCDIPSAIPLLFRAKRALIIGDNNQLIHLSSFSPERDAALAKRQKLDDRALLSFSYRDNSLFTLASQRVGDRRVFLDQHFRSPPAIITFSNDHFYGSRLTVMTDLEKRLPGPPIRWVHVAGQFQRERRGGSVVNPPEAEAVSEELAAIWGEYGTTVSIGVVTPYRAQVQAIREAVARRVPDAANNVIVDTAHRFQGDERDIVLFSPTVSADMPDYRATFASNPNLVNVAITRAKSRLVIVGDRDACLASPGVIGALAHYVKDLEEGGFGSPLERRLYERLCGIGFSPQPGVVVDGHKLDLVIEAHGVKLNIECDGVAPQGESARNQRRDEELSAAGWTVVRFGGADILRDIDACVNTIREMVKIPFAS